MSEFNVTIAGSGTSHGVPVAGCSCAVCVSDDPKDKRMRAVCFIQDEKTTVAIDAGPEFRIQLLKYKITNLDAVLLTHPHADHVHGLDDVRVFSVKNPIPVVSNAATLCELKKTYFYAFEETQIGGGKPKFSFLCSENFSPENPLKINSLEFIPIPLQHGVIQSCGWRCGNFAYLTDLNFLPPSSLALLKGVNTLVIDGLRKRPHATHFCFDESLACAAEIGASRVFITHITHDDFHKEISDYLTKKKCEFENLKNAEVVPAYDGLKIKVEC